MPPQPRQHPESLGKPRTVALALGSGGARGLAHIPVLEALDELGVAPVAVAGASIGAVVGSGYAAGMSGREIRAYAEETLFGRSEVVRRLFSLQLGEARKRFAESGSLRGLGAQLNAAVVLEEFLPDRVPRTFEELRIPLHVVTTDVWNRVERVIRSGSLRSAVAGSMAIPGVLQPVMHDDRLLIDGGTVNPLPFDTLRATADIVVAVDVTRSIECAEGTIPSPINSLFLALDIMTHTIVGAKLHRGAPDILLRPAVGVFGSLDFLRAAEILKASEPVKEELKRRLGELLG
ncbi:MAG TPA: patatin-like phospholipase family protein [Bauldia sp.]|nr:patatin-like phospholipase family protein [Bauldia sp.]